MEQSAAAASNHALEACERMLRPILRLALDRGLKYQDIDGLIRSLMLDEAARDWTKRNGKEPSGSQLSVTTGINRKEVKRLSDSSNLDNLRTRSEPQSLAAVMFAAWKFQAERDASLSELPVTSEKPHVYTFERLAGATIKDVHYRSILDELVRLRLVSETNGLVTLAATEFVPPGMSPELLEVIAKNTNSHLNAAVLNAIKDEEPFLEQAIGVTEVSLEACKQFHQTARTLWDTTRRTLQSSMKDAPVVEINPYQMRIGMYAYFELMNEQLER